MTRDEAIALVIHLEGGLVDNPADPGGRTNMGITQRYLDAERDSFRTALPVSVDDLTVAQVTTIYQCDQWAAVRGDMIPPALATLAFDAAVNEGPGTAVKLLQATVGTVPDGIMGPATLRGLTAGDPRALAAEYAARRATAYAGLGAREGQFELGWMRRLITVYTAAIK